MSSITFDYLPGSPLSNGWRPALPEKAGLKASVSPERVGAMSIQAEDAIDFEVPKYQALCNRVRFSAKLSHHSYAYVRVRLTSKDGHSVSRTAWLACDVGDRPPRRESRDEWAIYRKPDADGWTFFDLNLPGEVAATYGQFDGLQFGELVGFRLRGSLSISPIEFATGDFSEVPTSQETSPAASSRKAWSRGDVIGALTVLVALLAIAAGLVVPEARRFVGLDKPAPATPSKAAGRSVVAESAVDIHELRQKHGVTRLAESESEKMFSEVPAGSFGFVSAYELVSTSPDMFSISSDGFSRMFELHKLSNGSSMLAAYVGPETYQRLREGVSAGSDVTLYSSPWKEAPVVVSVPVGDLKFNRVRNLMDVEGSATKFTDTAAVDCTAR